MGLVVRAGDDGFDFGAAQDVDDGDGLDFLEAGREKDEGAHGGFKLPQLVQRRKRWGGGGFFSQRRKKRKGRVSRGGGANAASRVSCGGLVRSEGKSDGVAPTGAFPDGVWERGNRGKVSRGGRGVHGGKLGRTLNVDFLLQKR